MTLLYDACESYEVYKAICDKGNYNSQGVQIDTCEQTVNGVQITNSKGFRYFQLVVLIASSACQSNSITDLVVNVVHNGLGSSFQYAETLIVIFFNYLILGKISTVF